MDEKWCLCYLLLLTIPLETHTADQSLTKILRRLSRRLSNQSYGRRSASIKAPNHDIIQINKYKDNMSVLCRILANDTISKPQRNVIVGNKGSGSVLASNNTKTIICRGEIFQVEADKLGNLVRISKGGSVVLTTGDIYNFLFDEFKRYKEDVVIESDVGASLSSNSSRSQIGVANNVQDQKSSVLTRTNLKKTDDGAIQSTGEFSVVGTIKGKTLQGETRAESRVSVSKNPKRLRLRGGYRKLGHDTRTYMDHKKTVDFEIDI